MMKKLHQIVTVAVLSFTLCWGGGCGCRQSSPGSNEVSKRPSSKDEAVAVATAHLRKIGALPAEFQVVSVEQDDSGEWTVLIESLPQTPGRHIFVTIGKDGSILNVGPGA
jgi:hypothetical protein